MRAAPIVLALLAVAVVPGLAVAQDAPGPTGSVPRSSPAAQVAPTPPIRQRIRIRLDYLGAPGCAEGLVFKHSVRARLFQWEVWAPNAPWHLKLTVTGTGADDLYTGKAVLLDPQGAEAWKRSVTKPATCIGVLEDIALGLTIAVGPPPAPPPVCQPPPAPPAAQPPPLCAPALAHAPAPPPAPPTRLAALLGAGVSADVITTSRSSLGLSLDGSVRHGAFSVGLEGRWNPALGATAAGGGAVSFTRATGAVLVCMYHGPLMLCGLGEAGRFLFPQTVDSYQESFAYGALGVRLGALLPLPLPRLFLGAAGDLLGTVGTPEFTFDHRQLLHVAPVNASVGLALVVSLGGSR